MGKLPPIPSGLATRNSFEANTAAASVPVNFTCTCRSHCGIHTVVFLGKVLRASAICCIHPHLKLELSAVNHQPSITACYRWLAPQYFAIGDGAPIHSPSHMCTPCTQPSSPSLSFASSRSSSLSPSMSPPDLAAVPPALLPDPAPRFCLVASIPPEVTYKKVDSGYAST